MYIVRKSKKQDKSAVVATQKALSIIPSSERQKVYVKDVPLSKLIPFYGNDPDRVNRDLGDFQEMVQAFKAGDSVRGPVRAVYDSSKDLYYIINGHRSTEASKDAGFTDIDVLAVIPNPGENAKDLQEKLFALDNKNRPYKGKAMLRTAILTNGRTLMSTDIKRVWGIIQKYNATAGDLEWMAANASPDLIKATEELVNYLVLARMREGETTTFTQQRAFFITAMTTLKRTETLRETRDYVNGHLSRPNRMFENALNEGKVPAAVLSDAQKNKAAKAENAKKANAKRAKARAEARSYRE